MCVCACVRACVRVCVCVQVCINVCCRTAKILKKSPIWNQALHRSRFSSWPWPSFQGQPLGIWFSMRISRKLWEMKQTLLLPSDWKSCICHQMANVVHLDLDLHFQGHENWNVNISKMVRVSEKCSIMTFIEVDIYYRMVPLQMLYFV